MAQLPRPLKWGIVSGESSAIPEVTHREATHREAARLVEGLELAAGVFSVNPHQTPAPERQPPGATRRAYDRIEELIERETKLPEGERVDLISLIAPIEMRCLLAAQLLTAGFHVLCEKPLAQNFQEAINLLSIIARSRKLVAVNHTLTGYPMVRLARDMVRQGDLGAVHQVIVHCPQLTVAPKFDEANFIVRSIAAEAENLVEFIADQSLSMVCAEAALSSAQTGAGAKILLRLDKGGRGALHTGMSAGGEWGGVAFWVRGSRADLEWRQEHADLLYFKRRDAKVEVWRSGGERGKLTATYAEALIGAFANIYAGVAGAVRARLEGKKSGASTLEFPTIEQGVRAIQFGEAVLNSAKSHNQWIKMPR